MSFREAFTKQQRKNLLDYDDTAFLYFIFTLLTCITIPWLIVFLWRIIYPQPSLAQQLLNQHEQGIASDKQQFQKCYCNLCLGKLRDSVSKQDTLKSMFKSRKFRLQGTTLLVLVFILICLFRSLMHVSELQMFDPFEILGVSPSSPDRTIKKAYRTLSLKHHPDKNPNDPSAAAKFIIINKAYQSLTDETARENYKKYGNPDGPGVMELGIGLPKILVDEKNQDICLLGLLLVFVFIVPSCFIVYYEKQRNFYPSGLRVETIHFFAYCISSNATEKTLPELLAASIEARSLPERGPKDAEIVADIASRVQDVKKTKLKSPVVYRNTILLFGHMHQLTDRMTDEMKQDLAFLLRLSLPMTASMLEIAFLHGWGNVVQSIIKLRRCLIQATAPLLPPFSQIPHYPLFKKKLTLSFKELIEMSESDRTKLLSGLPEAEMSDVNQFCSNVSKLSLNVKVFVKEEKDIVENDVVTVQVEVVRDQLGEGCYTGVVHAPYFPQLKLEELWIFLLGKETDYMVTYVHSKTPKRNIVEELEFLAPSAGVYMFKVVVMSDTYIGVDVQQEIRVQVLSKASTERQIYLHPDDLALDNEPSLIQQMIGNVDEEAEKDEDDEISS